MNDHFRGAGQAEAAARLGGERAHRLGVGTNALLGVIKLSGGLAAGSPALVADGWHSLADFLTTGVAWASFRLGAQPPDDDHHYGHGKLEALAAVGVGGVLAAGGGVLLWSALPSGPLAGVGGELVPALALAIAAASMAVNEWLARVTGKAGRRLRSPALMAVSRDNRADALSSLLVMVGVGGRALGWGWTEPTATALIALTIVIMGLKSVREGGDVLVDRVTDPSLRSEITRAALVVDGVLDVDRVRVHPLGSAWTVDVEISVDGGLTVREGHDIAHAVEAALTALRDGIVGVQVHVNAHGA